MAKYLVVGDLHERISELEKAITKFKDENYDKIIFIGDYCDSFTHNKTTLLKLLNLLVKFKRENYDKVVCLFGNHDVHYLFSPFYRCTGFQADSLYEVRDLFEQNIDCFEWYYCVNGYLFTHAGITNSWVKDIQETFKHYDKSLTILENIDRLSYSKEGLDLLCKVGIDRGGKGNSGLLWVDKNILIRDAYYDKNIKYQIVGHTYVEQITRINNLYFTDCLGNTSEFLTLYI